MANPKENLVAGQGFLVWFHLKFAGNAIATDTPVKGALIDNISTDAKTIVIIPAVDATWNSTGGKDGTGAWELEFSGEQTRLVRLDPDRPTSSLKASEAFIELRVEGSYKFTYHHPVKLAKGTIEIS
ncbi:MAG: hypothetical protein AAFY20_09315 [Cyanobacteria bacterium J06639_14]